MNVRYGLIGYGRWGALHAASIRRTPGAELTAIAVSSEQSAARVRDAEKVQVYTNMDAMLARDDIDVVDIVLPNDLHHEAALKALRAGKHVLVEKPLATCVEHGEELAEAAVRSGQLVHVGHELRFSPLWGTVKTMIGEGKLGRLKRVKISLSRQPYRAGAGGWRMEPDRVGSWILEEPIHFYDLIRWYFEGTEAPASVWAFGNSRSAELERAGLFENSITVISFSDGGYGEFSQTLAAYEHHLEAELVGTAGCVKLWWSGVTDETREPQFRLEWFDGKRKHTVPLRSSPGEVYELDKQIGLLTEAVRCGGRAPVGVADGLWAVRICLAAQQSAVCGAAVDLGEAR